MVTFERFEFETAFDQQVDPEKRDAVAKLLELRNRAGLAHQVPRDRYLAMPDHELRQTLLAARQAAGAVTQYVNSPGPRQAATLNKIALAMGLKPGAVDLAEFALGLYRRFSIQVASDGLIEAERLTDRVRSVVGGAQIAMWHHTSTALLDKIRAEGLKVGKQTNFFNTQAGVYLSTIAHGRPVDTYAQRAARVHGGSPVHLRVGVYLSELTPDPDDADLDWAQGRQFVTPSVAPDRLADLPWREVSTEFLQCAVFEETDSRNQSEHADKSWEAYRFSDGRVVLRYLLDAAGAQPGVKPGVLIDHLESAYPGRGYTRQALFELRDMFGPVTLILPQDATPESIAYAQHMQTRGLVAQVLDSELRELFVPAAEKAGSGHHQRER